MPRPPKRPFRPVSGNPRRAPKPDPRKESFFGAARAKPDKGVIWKPGPNAKVIRSEIGMDLAHVLVSQTNKKLSVRAARAQIAAGHCRVNGRVESFGSYKVQAGDIIEFFAPEEREHVFDPTRVLHVDVAVIAYDKPPRLPVVPTDGAKSWSLYDILKQQYPDILPVHRLDADTSGIVLFARTKDAQARLEVMFKDHIVEKSYLALVRGHPREEGNHKSYLIKTASSQGQEKWKSGRGENAREAITSWKVLDRIGPYASLVQVSPKTGRYHQIRIHFSELDHPLYGDRLYGDRRDPVHADRHMLHASDLVCPNPGGGHTLKIHCEPPKDFLAVIERLKAL